MDAFEVWFQIAFNKVTLHIVAVKFVGGKTPSVTYFSTLCLHNQPVDKWA